MANPDPPAVVVISKACDSLLNLAWSPVAGATSYTIYHVDSPEDYTSLGSVPGSASGVIVAPFQPGGGNLFGVSVTTADGTSYVQAVENGNYNNYVAGIPYGQITVPCIPYGVTVEPPPGTWSISDPIGVYYPTSGSGYSAEFNGDTFNITCWDHVFDGIGYSSYASVYMYQPGDSGNYDIYYGNFIVVDAYNPCQQGPGC